MSRIRTNKGLNGRGGDRETERKRDFETGCETCQSFPEGMPVAGKPGRVWEGMKDVEVEIKIKIKVEVKEVENPSDSR